ncbi:MAG: hypothetical protein AB1752_13940 [Candidatus Zixiibacteriota bacterium]
MAVRNFLIVALVGASLALAPLEGLTDTTKTAASKAEPVPSKATAATAKTAPVKAEGAATASHKFYGNTLAVCGCGKVFAPDANTKYIENMGTKYACCSDACHEMAMKDPAATARKATEQTGRVLTQLSTTRQN